MQSQTTIPNAFRSDARDLRDPLRALLSSLAESGISALVDWLHDTQVKRQSPTADASHGDDVDTAARDAAALLGVALTAGAADVRAAFRAR